MRRARRRRSSDDAPRKKVHLVVAGASQWGQHACAHVLHRSIGRGGRVTLIVARRFEHLFRNRRPSIKEWERYGSLKECLDDLRADGQPIDYVFDDHLHHLAAQLFEHQREYLRLGYVVTGAEEHYPYTQVLSICCDRVLVEKPISKLVRDVDPVDGRFRRLARELPAGGQERVFGCDHFSFRKGFTDALQPLDGFIERHLGHRLRYHFSFFETATREALTARPAAMQDGSLLDVAITHGLGPLSYLVKQARHFREAQTGPAAEPPDLHRAITWESAEGFQLRERADAKAPLIVPVLAETAARVEGTYHEPGIAPADGDARGWRIDLVLESAKAAARRDRFLRLDCETCTGRVRGPGRGVDAVYFGISLGAAGYTVCDFAGRHSGEEFAPPGEVADSHPLKAPEFDGGWRSDRAGGNVEAEVAQAAMLEAFFAPVLDDRFIPIDEACRIVRLGMEAQALAFCGPRPAYVLGHDFGADERDRSWPGRPETGAPAEPAPRNEEHRELKKLWRSTTGTRATALFPAALGLPEDESLPASCYRILTVLGPEGYGNSDVAAILRDKLGAPRRAGAAERRARRFEVRLLSVGRDEQWCLDLGSGTSTEDRLVRELVEALGIGSTTADTPAAKLLGRLADCRCDLERECRVLIFNGIDRLGDKPWAELVGFLNQLPASHRLVFVTNRGDRAVGPVFETAELVEAYRSVDQRLDTRGDRRRLAEAVGRLVLGNDPADEREDARRVREDVERSVDRLAQGNLTVERQLFRWLADVVVPAQRAAHRDARRFTTKRAWGALLHELAVLSVPQTLTPFPERLLDRVSLSCLAALGATDRDAVAALARLSDGAPDEALHLAFPGFAARASVQGPLRSLFLRTEGQWVLFPRVRRAAVRLFEDALASMGRRGAGKEISPEDPAPPGDGAQGDELRKLLREIDDRRLLLALPQGSHYDEARLDRLQAMAERGVHGLGKLDLDGTLMEDLLLDLAESFEVGVRGRTDLRAARLLGLLIEKPTNLAMLTRARFLNLDAWAGAGGATSSPQLVPIMNRLADADRVAELCAPFEAALHPKPADDEPPEAPDPGSRDQRRRARHALLRVRSHRNLLMADVFRTQAWYWLLGLDAPSGYVFEQEDRLLRSAAEARRFLGAAANGEEERLRAQLLAVLAFFYARDLTGQGQPPLEESFGYDGIREDLVGLGSDAARRLALGLHLTREALGINVSLSRLSSRKNPDLEPLALDAASGACRNRLNLALFSCLLAEKVGSDLRACYREEAAAAFVQAGKGRKAPRCNDEPYYALVQARMLDQGIVKGKGTDAVQCASRAVEGYRRRGQEYFVTTAKAYLEKLTERKAGEAAG